MRLLLCKLCSLQVPVLGLYYLRYGINIKAIDHLKDNIPCIKVQMNSLCWCSFNYSFFCFPGVCIYLPFSYAQKKNVFSSSTAINMLLVACQSLLRAVIILFQPTSHCPLPFTPLAQQFMEFLVFLFFCFIPYFAVSWVGRLSWNFHMRKSMGEVNFLNPSIPGNIFILVFCFACASVSSSEQWGWS